MKKQEYLKRVIWAVDPFQNNKATEKIVVQALRALTKNTLATIEPIHVLTVDGGVMEVAPAPKADWKKRFQRNAEKQLKSYLKRFKIPNLGEPKVLTCIGSTSKQSIQALCSYANYEKADMIVASSHARKGLSRFFLGSFAETLLLLSDTPVYLVNPKCKPKTEIANLLFPTDFSEESKTSFKSVLKFAQQNNSKITLYHKVTGGMEPVLSSSVAMLGGGWVPVKTYFSDETEKKQDVAKVWAQEAKERGVRVEYKIDANPGNIPESILKMAKKIKADVIAIASQSGAVTSALLGSIARQVVRDAHVPVWVLHSEGRKAISISERSLDDKPITKVSSRVIV